MNIEERKKARRLSIGNRELLIATTENDLKKVDDILKTGVDVDFKDRDGNTALHWAVESGNVKGIELLLSKGASTQSKNNKAETPLDISKRLNHQHIVDILLPPKQPPSRNKGTPKKESKTEPSVSSASELQKNNKTQATVESTLERRKNAVHGNMYQLKLLMLFLYRGVSLKYSFRLGTEIQEAKKFDDLVFEYDVDGKRIYRLLQAKHRLDESKTINTASLLKESDGDFSLVKYFFSYLALKKDKLFNKGFIKDVTICTNIDFDIKNLQSNSITVEKIVEKDEILDANSKGKESARYRFSGDIVKKLKLKLQNCSSPGFEKADAYTDNDIAKFIKCLVFAVNQPNEDELGNIVKHELSQEFDFVTAENVYNKFFISMLNWLQGKEKGIFLSYEDGKEFFVEFDRNIQIWFGVKDPVESFSGRLEFLNNLHRILNTEKAVNGKLPFVCVSGLGGVGKSELARKYVSTYSQEYDDKIVWINAERYETLADSFRRLACDKLKIGTLNADKKEKKLKSIVEDVYAFFSDKKCLFIFDNAEQYKSQQEFDNGIEAFLPCLPDASNKMHVLITSRNQKWPKKVKVLLLHVFSESEASEFVKKSLNLTDNDQTEDIRKLVNELQFLPLALQQAVAYVALQDKKLKNLGSEFKISNYLKKYKQKTKEYYNFTSDDENDYSETIYSTWNITLDAIRQKANGPETCEILEILSYFAPTKISVRTIKALIEDKIILAAALDLLKQYSIIDVQNKILSLHRLVIKVIILQLKDQKREQKILHKALNIFSKATLTLENVEHAISVWNHSSKYCKLIDEFSVLPSGIIEMLMNSLRFEEAELYGIKAFNQLDALTPKSHATKLNFIETTMNAALALNCRGKYESSAKYLENAYEMQKRIFGPKSFEALSVRKSMSENLIQLHQYDRALAICEEIIEIESKTMGRNNIFTSYTLFNKANILQRQSKMEESLLIVNEVLSIRESILGKTHPETLHIKSVIAVLLSSLGKHSEAAKIEQELSIQEVIDDDLSRQIIKKTNKGIMLLNKGKFKEALSIFKEAYEGGRIFGEDHPTTLDIERRIGSALRFTEKLDESLNILKKVYEKQKKIFGPDYPDTILTVNEIGFTLSKQRKFTESLKLLEDSLEKCKTVFGQDHKSTLQVIAYITEILMQQQEHDESYTSSYTSHLIKYRREIFKINEEEGYHQKDYLNLKVNIAAALYNSGELDEASKMFREIDSKKEYSTHPAIISWKKNCLRILSSENKFEEALKLGKEILDAQVIAFGKGHKETFDTKVDIAILLHYQKKNYSSLQICREIFDTADDEILNYLGINRMKELRHTVEMNIALLLSVMRKNDFEALQKLFDEGHEVNSADENDTTLLHYAAGNGQTKLVEILLQNGADVTLVNIRGYTALHAAAVNGSLNIIKLLLKYRSMYNVRNKQGAIPLDLCRNETSRRLLMIVEDIFEDAAKGRKRIVEKLEKLQSDELEAIQKTRDSRGRTFLQVIIRHGHGLSLIKR